MPCHAFQVVHHILAGVAVVYAMFFEEGQVYTFMVLISEVTTPEINMRWLGPHNMHFDLSFHLISSNISH